MRPQPWGRLAVHPKRADALQKIVQAPVRVLQPADRIGRVEQDQPSDPVTHGALELLRRLVREDSAGGNAAEVVRTVRLAAQDLDQEFRHVVPE